MPATGTYAIDTGQTFSTVILMGSAPRLKFGTTEQDVSANGEKKWELQTAVTFHAQHGMRPVSEVITVVVTGPPADPAAQIPPGSQVELAGFRVGISTPEHRENGRIMGGRPWYQASGVRAVNGHRPAAEGK
jgi:hypothetical protein